MVDVGDKVGLYELKRRLGTGGMGAVFAAFDEKRDKEVALKVLLPEHLDDREYRQRFKREAEALRGLNEIAGVVRFYDMDKTPDGTAYIATELIAGKTLRERMRESENRIPVREAIAIVREVAQSMTKVHAAGVTHRDLKPENIMLVDPDGHPCIIDFGVVKLQPKTRPDDQATTNLLTTSPPGTSEYMAPECVLDANKCSPKMDVYALGIILHEILAGVRPFEGMDRTELLHPDRNIEPRRLDEIDTQISPELADVVESMLEKAPQNRPTMQQCAELLALDQTMGELSRTQRFKNRVRRGIRRLERHPLIRRARLIATPRRILAFVALVLFIIGGWWWHRGSDDAFDNHMWGMRESLEQSKEIEPVLRKRLDLLRWYDSIWPGVRRRGRILVLHQLSDYERIHGTLAAAMTYEDNARTLIDQGLERESNDRELVRLRAMSLSKRGKFRLAEKDAACAVHDFRLSVDDIYPMPQKSQEEWMILATSRLELGQAMLLAGDDASAAVQFSEAKTSRQHVADSTEDRYWRIMFAEGFLFQAKSTKDAIKVREYLDQAFESAKGQESQDQTWLQKAIVARTHCEYGHLYLRDHNAPKAREKFGAARDIAKELHAQAPTHKDNALILVEALQGLETTTESSPAKESYKKDRCDLVRTFADRDPDDKRFSFRDCFR